MIKVYCDRCGKEFEFGADCAKIEIIEKRSVLLPNANQVKQLGNQVVSQLYHLCPSCTRELKSNFFKPKKDVQ